MEIDKPFGLKLKLTETKRVFKNYNVNATEGPMAYGCPAFHYRKKRGGSTFLEE